MKAQIFNHSEWLQETDHEKLKKFFKHALGEAEFMICNYQEKHFQPFGFTGLWLLAESHFAVHTFPEENTTYIEMSSCSQEKNDAFLRHLNNAKKAGVII